MPTNPVPATPQRTSRRVFLPTLIVVILAIAWSGFWWYASQRVQAEWDLFVAQQASVGRKITCGEQSLAGYPFRLEMHCASPDVESTRPGEAFTVKLAELNALAMVYQPNRVLLQAKGPLSLTDNANGDMLSASWTSAEGSMAIWTGGPQNADLVITGLEASATRAGAEMPIVKNTNVEAHIRAAEGANAGPGAYDIVAKADASVPLIDQQIGTPAPFIGQVQGTITKVDLGREPLPERLRRWAADGGSLNIVFAQLDHGGTSVKANGTVQLGADGRPMGDLTAALAGVEELTATLSRLGLASGNMTTLLGVGLRMLGQPTNIDGKAAVQVMVKLADGKASIGSLPLGLNLPRLF